MWCCLLAHWLLCYLLSLLLHLSPAATLSVARSYSGEVVFEDGKRWALQRRERPKILLGSDGRPTHLFNGVCPPNNTEQGLTDPAGHCFTMVQEIVHAGWHA